jgi:hypothetical protein
VFAAYDPSFGWTNVVTGSTSVTEGEWHHAAVTFDGAAEINLYLDLQHEGTIAGPFFPPIPAGAAFASPTSYTGSFHIGAEWGGTVTGTREDPSVIACGLSGTVFHGFVGEVRMWGGQKTWTQISSSHNVRITGSALAAPMLAQFRLSEGPLAKCVPSSDPSGLQAVWSPPTVAQGSGTLNWASAYQGRAPDVAFLYSFNSRPGPTWHPNDNDGFYVPKQFALSSMSGTNWGPSGSASVERLRIISVPAGMYGRQIVPGSVSITDRAFSAKSYRLVRTLLDDGRGGLFLSGSARSGSYAFGVQDVSLTPSEPQYRGVEWNKVGNVFYDEGLIVIKDPALLDFGSPTDYVSAHPSDLLQVSFRGSSRVPVKTLMCRIDRGDLNASLNQSFYRTEEDGDRVRRHPSGSIYVTTVGIYNSDRELVGVARLAEPLRVRPRDRMNVKLRMDF